MAKNITIFTFYSFFPFIGKKRKNNCGRGFCVGFFGGKGMHYLDYNEKIEHGTPDFPIAFYHVDEHHSRYNMPFHWHKEMEIICIDKGNGLARLNRETLRLKEGDLLIVNSGVLHGIKSDSRHILYYRSVVFDLSFLAGPAGDLCQEKVISLLMENRAEFTHLITPANENYNNIFHLFCDSSGQEPVSLFPQSLSFCSNFPRKSFHL